MITAETTFCVSILKGVLTKLARQRESTDNTHTPSTVSPTSKITLGIRAVGSSCHFLPQLSFSFPALCYGSLQCLFHSLNSEQFIEFWENISTSIWDPETQFHSSSSLKLLYHDCNSSMSMLARTRCKGLGTGRYHNSYSCHTLQSLYTTLPAINIYISWIYFDDLLGIM